LVSWHPQEDDDAVAHYRQAVRHPQTGQQECNKLLDLFSISFP
jgi:hypothetical protein